MQRQEVFFSGRVQGVGFRYTTRSIAARYAVTGYVENLPDGRVHMIAEGEPAEVKAFVRAVADEMQPNITDMKTDARAANGEFAGFTIRT
ncbi:MAG: acylphosphatase [Planctomycetaceae bacterium]|nr:acylphosphatase [Planctomycetaceae bacterium]